MPRKDRDFEPNRVKKGGRLSRWLFPKFGIMSAKQRRERDDAANE